MIFTVMLNKDKDVVDILLDEEGAQFLIDNLTLLKKKHDHVHLAVWSGELTSNKVVKNDFSIIEMLNLGVVEKIPGENNNKSL